MVMELSSEITTISNERMNLVICNQRWDLFNHRGLMMAREFFQKFNKQIMRLLLEWFILISVYDTTWDADKAMKPITSRGSFLRNSHVYGNSEMEFFFLSGSIQIQIALIKRNCKMISSSKHKLWFEMNEFF